MKILVVGGGSGGHITPAVAVVRKILELKPRAKVEFWTDRKYYKTVVKTTTEVGLKPVEVGLFRGEKRGRGTGNCLRVRKISAGKFRRYAGWGIKDYFENIGITLRDLVFKNIVNFFKFIGGLIESFVRLVGKDGRPDVIFLKGGYVGLPVGLVAQALKIPYVIHESDAVPGLANRILMKKATVVASGLKLKGSDTVFTGTPVAPEFKAISESKQRALKKALGFDPERPLVMITGGSQGSEHINLAVKEVLPEMLEFTSVGLVAGKKHYEEMTGLKKYEKWDKAHLVSNFRLWSFNTMMYELLGAADVVVSRAGATTIAELAALKKAVVLVPFEKLPGGHQVKNAEQLVELEAAAIVRDDRMVEQPGILLNEVKKLIRSPKKRQVLAENLHKQAKTEAAGDLAEIIVKVGEKK